MPLLAKETSKGEDFAPIPAGLHHAVCYAVIDIGTQPQTGNFPSRRKALIMWEIPGERIDLTKDGKTTSLPRAISARYTNSLASKGNLRPMLESWRGRAFTTQELEGFDLFTVIGANCFINVVHENGKGQNAKKVYANVKAVNPLPKGMARLKPENPTITFSMDDFNSPVQIPESIPEWVETLIKGSDEYLLKAQAQPHHAPPAQEEAPAIDDDIPF